MFISLSLHVPLDVNNSYGSVCVFEIYTARLQDGAPGVSFHWPHVVILATTVAKGTLSPTSSPDASVLRAYDRDCSGHLF